MPILSWYQVAKSSFSLSLIYLTVIWQYSSLFPSDSLFSSHETRLCHSSNIILLIPPLPSLLISHNTNVLVNNRNDIQTYPSNIQLTFNSNHLWIIFYIQRICSKWYARLFLTLPLCKKARLLDMHSFPLHKS